MNCKICEPLKQAGSPISNSMWTNEMRPDPCSQIPKHDPKRATSPVRYMYNLFSPLRQNTLLSLLFATLFFFHANDRVTVQYDNFTTCTRSQVRMHLLDHAKILAHSRLVCQVISPSFAKNSHDSAMHFLNSLCVCFCSTDPNTKLKGQLTDLSVWQFMGIFPVSLSVYKTILFVFITYHGKSKSS